MKKLVTIFALFTMVMLTSFVEPTEIGGKNLGSLRTYSSTEIGGKNLGSLKSSTNYEIGGKNLGSL